ncbi:hypothetical protein [Limnovirga soli]|uniref:Uncharacterized protein n=1 Tax=Limnovirga soli TaxID=2656915 RepID=A0A8J8F9Q8_9BACT|nr:hypothetical protein [Limnovirga soli]NNV54105.1 hypothetical protein [Limnovirga soli]
MTQLVSLKVSIYNFAIETNRISQLIDSRFTNLIFYPNILEADIDYKNYCNQLDAIKKYSDQLTINDDTIIIKEKISELPTISQSDFQIYSWGINQYMLFILLPLGLIGWTNTYFKIIKLQTKLKDTERTIGTLSFMLKALTNSN